MIKENVKQWFIDSVKLFDDLNVNDKTALQNVFTEKIYNKNDFLFLQGDEMKEFIFVNAGRVKIIKNGENGKESIKRILNEGDYYGEKAVLDPEHFSTHNNTGKVLDKDTVVFSIPVEELKHLCEAYPIIYKKIVKKMMANYHRLDKRIESVMLKNSKDRIIDFLKEMAEDIGKPVGYEMLIKHNLTHQEIANITGISRQKVTTILNEFKQQGLIHLERNAILVHDLDLLR